MNPVKTLIALDNGMAEAAVIDALALGSGFAPEVVSGMDAAASSVHHDYELVVIACTGYSDEVRGLVEHAVAAEAERPVVVLCWGSAGALMRPLFAAGATDILAMPCDPATARFALEKAVARTAGNGTAPSPLICVIGAKGGSGKTLTASNLAAGLAAGGKRVAIVDADLQFGDVGITLGLAPTRTVFDLARVGGQLDQEKLEDFLVSHHSGVDALLAPLRPEEADDVSIDMLLDVCSLLRETHDYVVVDTCPGFPPEVIALIDAASHLCVVGSLDASSLKDTRIGLETLERMGYDRDNICLVLNKIDTGIGISLAEAETVLGRTPDISVPAERAVARSSNIGAPIVLESGRKGGEAAKSFQALAAWFRRAQWQERQVDAGAPAGGRGLFARLRRPVPAGEAG